MEAFRQNQRRGAALMLSLWALFLLSAMVISWALLIGSRMTMSGNANRTLEAAALACSGAEVSLVSKPGSPALVGGFGRDKTYEVRMTGEGGRLNLRWLLTSFGAKPALREILRKYLEIKGIDLNERDRMIDTLIDWVDPDNLVGLNGAEDEPGYKPANRMISRIDELKKIKGWEEFTSTNGWDADFTLDSVGPIDIAWASRDVLLALPGVSEDRVDQFLDLRSGPDGIDGTEDDAAFKSKEEALAVLGAQGPEISSVTTFKGDPTFRVVSLGKSGEVTRTVRMVFQRANPGSPVQLKSWKEF